MYLNHIWSNQLYDTFNGLFLLDITYHYTIVTIVPIINCPQKRILVKFRDHSGQNIARLKLEVEHYVNNHIQINQDVSSNQIICVATYSLSIAIIFLSRKNKYLLQDFASLGFLTLFWNAN